MGYFSTVTTGYIRNVLLPQIKSMSDAISSALNGEDYGDKVIANIVHLILTALNHQQ